MAKLAIIGAGVIGLSIAVEALKARHRVTVYEQGATLAGLPGKASWVAAGMLAAQVEATPGEEALLPMLEASRQLWPAFASGLGDIDYRQEGTLVAAHDADSGRWLKHYQAFLEKCRIPVETLNAKQTRAIEPALTPRVVAGFYSPTDYQVDAQKLLAALHAKVLHEGGQVSFNQHMNKPPEDVDITVFSTGAWAEAVRPVKGQLLVAQHNNLLNHVVWGQRIYLAPKSNGRLYIGASVEEQGFSTTITAGVVQQLLEDAIDLVPEIAELPLLETLTGLRPGTPTNVPIIKRINPTTIIATGHYRNGILLAPNTAKIVLSLI